MIDRVRELNDFQFYTTFLSTNNYDRGIDLTPAEMLTQHIISTALSWHFWESAYNVFVDYPFHGKRKGKPFSLKASERVKFFPPFISVLLTERGTAYDIHNMIKVGNLPIDVSLTMPAFPGESKVSYGAGVELYDIKLFKLPIGNSGFQFSVYTTPSVRINSNKDLGMTGYALSKSTRLKLHDNFSIVQTTNYSDNDPLANDVKMDEEGITAYFGIMLNLPAF